jgi:hypothetical protein
MSKARFEAELLLGHKGVTCIVVPFDPEAVWARPPHRLAGRRHGWLVKGTMNEVRFEGHVGDRWGRFFIIVEPEIREKAGLSVGDMVKVVVEPAKGAKALAKAIEQSKQVTQPKIARADAIAPEA